VKFYRHHIGDYMRDTAHLSMIEDGAYRRLLDIYYSREKALPAEKSAVYRLVRAQAKDEKKAVDAVLAEFFVLDDGLLHNPRADEEIAGAQEEGVEALAKKENERERQRRHRERRRALFEKIRSLGEVPKWDTSTEALESLLSRLQKRTCHGDRLRDRNGDNDAPDTANHYPLPNTHNPVVNPSSAIGEVVGVDPDTGVIGWGGSCG
jgi:uncharacterized protein YdaU (DUF1376 family)